VREGAPRRGRRGTDGAGVAAGPGAPYFFTSGHSDCDSGRNASFAGIVARSL
jgi:hypothetical protein